MTISGILIDKVSLKVNVKLLTLKEEILWIMY